MERLGFGLGLKPDKHECSTCHGEQTIVQSRLPALRLLEEWECSVAPVPVPSEPRQPVTSEFAEAIRQELRPIRDALHEADQYLVAAVDALLRAVMIAFPAPCLKCGAVGGLQVDPETGDTSNDCSRCHGTGREPCPNCGGRPQRRVVHRLRLNLKTQLEDVSVWTCPFCCGSGALSPLAPGVCANCNRYGEWHEDGCCIGALRHENFRDGETKHHQYEERPGPLSDPWPRMSP